MVQEYLNALPSGYQLQEYRMDQVLGVGGFGITYLAWDTNLNMPVAIKEYMPNEYAVRQGETTVKPKSTGDEESYQWGLDRFLQEAQTLARFRHPAIVPVLRFFEAHGTAYMVMEYQEGESLSELLDRKGTLTEQELLGILMPLLGGLEEVHNAGVLHRDIKPGNIYIRADGSPVLLDFGAARQAVGQRSKSLTAIVTPGYAPYEQYTTSSDQGPWTDIYALAAVCYRALTSDRPIDAPDRMKRDKLVPAVKVGKGKYSQHVLEAIDASLHVDEEKRPPSVAAFRAMLEGGGKPAVRPAMKAKPADDPTYSGATILRDTPSGPTGPTRAASQRTGRTPGKIIGWVVGGLAVVVLLAAGGIYALTSFNGNGGGGGTTTAGTGGNTGSTGGGTEIGNVGTGGGTTGGSTGGSTGGGYGGSKVKAAWCVPRSRKLINVKLEPGSPNKRADFSDKTCNDDGFLVSNIRQNGDQLNWDVPFVKTTVQCGCIRPGTATAKAGGTIGGGGSTGGSTGGGGIKVSGDKVKPGWCVKGSETLVSSNVQSGSQWKKKDFSNADCRNKDYYVRKLRTQGKDIRWSVPFTKASIDCRCQQNTSGSASIGGGGSTGGSTGGTTGGGGSTGSVTPGTGGRTFTHEPTKHSGGGGGSNNNNNTAGGSGGGKTYAGSSIKAGWCVAGSQRLDSKNVSASSSFKPSEFTHADCRNLNYSVNAIRQSGGKLRWTVPFPGAKLQCSCKPK